MYSICNKPLLFELIWRSFGHPNTVFEIATIFLFSIAFVLLSFIFLDVLILLPLFGFLSKFLIDLKEMQQMMVLKLKLLALSTNIANEKILKKKANDNCWYF